MIEPKLPEIKFGTSKLKKGFAKMQKGGVIMDVTNVKQAQIAEDSGAVAVMALERVPADIRTHGGVARMADTAIIKNIMNAVSIPVMAKVRIGHFVEAQALQALGVDMIDESEVLFDRLRQHAGTKEFWNEAIVIFSKDENLNKAHIKYLEYRMYELAKKSKRYIVENSQEPTRSAISEADKAEMEEFLENIQLLINTMGYKVFTELKEEIEVAKSNIYHIKAARGAEAKGQPTQEGFVVFKNSIMTSETVPSMPSWVETIRNQLISEEIVKPDNNGNYLFVTNNLFNSPSSAAAAIMGRSANGLKEWKNNNGISLGESESS